MALLLGKCLYSAASVISDFSARRAVVTLERFLSSRRLAKDCKIIVNLNLYQSQDKCEIVLK
jgi:hypothetical protein